ncbi:MAG: hypothetical protein A2511_00875 [Deltaproteobacteria bacterium RIFOXYD12_FULL_50_9]|nr:MAG: hypothetical protein A2511_00875 [Deltaproteobacteria bacterium RIFOXYD12_FULL_50_9]
MLRLFVFIIFIALTGCALNNNKLADFNYSLKNRNYAQAAVRLERCADFGRDSKKCQNLLNELKSSDLLLVGAIQKYHEEQIKKLQQEKEKNRVNALRKSNNPWDKLSLALDIQAGVVEKAYPEEDSRLIEQAFFSFGKCAKQTNPSCMTQYAQMILYGMSILPPEEKKSAREKALYWLNLSARYGNENARRLLITLEENIPTPDLSMESLQKAAISIARDDLEAMKEAERRQSYYNSQMLQETNQANFISSMNYFFPKTVNCTTNSLGAYTYTNCQ